MRQKIVFFLATLVAAGIFYFHPPARVGRPNPAARPTFSIAPLAIEKTQKGKDP